MPDADRSRRDSTPRRGVENASPVQYHVCGGCPHRLWWHNVARKRIRHGRCRSRQVANHDSNGDFVLGHWCTRDDESYAAQERRARIYHTHGSGPCRSAGTAGVRRCESLLCKSCQASPDLCRLPGVQAYRAYNNRNSASDLIPPAALAVSHSCAPRHLPACILTYTALRG